MRTDPYLTRDSLSRFYAEEYYDIYLGETELEDFLLDQKKRAARLIRWLNDYRINGYKSVFEVGCGPGGILEVFRSKGLYVAGCDYQLKFLSYGQRMNLNVTYGDAKSLHSFGKTDLLILSHVLEHFRDPVAEVKQMHTLLNNGGLIFIEVPGIFSINRTYGDLLLFLQNAHAWHFCLDTLDFIMARAGFTRIAGDELVRAVYKIAPEGFVVREKPYIHRRIVNYFLRAELNRNIKHLLQIPIHSKNAILNSEKN
jgi:SAM-dependent methyltransferase